MAKAKKEILTESHLNEVFPEQESSNELEGMNIDEAITATERKTRERRKAPTVGEAIKMIRLMNFPDRATVIAGVRNDMRKDVEVQAEATQATLRAHQEALDNLKNIEI